jgi:putative flippase GtrA
VVLVAEQQPSSVPAAGKVPAAAARLPQWLRFGVIGALNTGLSFGCYLVLLALGLPFALANLLALLLGIVVSFRTQGRWVFGSNDWSRMRRFAPVWLVLYLLNIAGIAGLMRLGLTPAWAGLVALPFVVVLSYLLQRRWVFRHEGKTSAGVAQTSRT